MSGDWVAKTVLFCEQEFLVIFVVVFNTWSGLTGSPEQICIRAGKGAGFIICSGYPERIYDAYLPTERRDGVATPRRGVGNEVRGFSSPGLSRLITSIRGRVGIREAIASRGKQVKSMETT